MQKKRRRKREQQENTSAYDHWMATIPPRWWRLIVIVVVGFYLYPNMDRGWIRHDEGVLGQVAERVLYGELPHLDFDDPYTGGLSLFYAGVFKIFGINLYNIRVVLLVFAASFSIAVFEIASRFLSRIAAASTTFLVVVWSLPNYFAGMPSWYNLFFTVFGIWVLIKFAETGKNRWLLLGGCLGGLSILVKVSGLFFVAGALLFIVYYEQLSEGYRSDLEAQSQGNRASRLFSWFTMIWLVAFLFALGYLLRSRLTMMNVLHFWLPCGSLCVFLMFNEWRQTSSYCRLRFINLARMIASFGIGCAIPIVPFIVQYSWMDGLEKLVHGVFIAPQMRIELADLSLPSFWTVVAAIPLAMLIALPFVVNLRWATSAPRWCLATIGILAAMLGGVDIFYQYVWFSVRPCIPIVAVVGCILLASARFSSASLHQKLSVFLLLAMSSAFSLIQFPFSHGIYFCYTAPLVILAIAAIVSLQPDPPWRLHGLVLAFYMLFAIFWMNRSEASGIGIGFQPYRILERSEIPRLGLKVEASGDSTFASVIQEIQLHSTDGEYIFATADCPEIYFLSERRNPTRTFFDFFDEDYRESSGTRLSRIMRTLDEERIRVVVFHWRPDFSDQPSEELYLSVNKVFPNSKHFLIDLPPPENKRPIYSVLWR